MPLETPVADRRAVRPLLGVELAIMTDDQVQNAVAIAIESLKGEAPALDFQSVHERSTAHRLAVQLESQFKTWNVDCEYDRDGQLQKRLMHIAQCNSRKATDGILPDIIVHHRRGQGLSLRKTRKRTSAIGGSSNF
jgi:HPt (histidine-containing phosphotransfer) domain-containing protein